MSYKIRTNSAHIKPYIYDGEVSRFHLGCEVQPIVGLSRLEPPRGWKRNLCSCGRIFMNFFLIRLEIFVRVEWTWSQVSQISGKGRTRA